jgi:putative ABC transport system substrate-binding protein
MKRREFLGLLGGAATLPLAAQAQQSMPVIGFLNTASAEAFADYVHAFLEGLGTVGYVEGRNVLIEYRWAQGNDVRLKDMAADLVRRRVDVIAATGGSPAALEAKAATSSIPIVFQVGVDPIKVGLVASLNSPGGNVTGAYMLADVLGPKRLGLLHELTPKATSFVALFNPTASGAETQIRDLTETADKLGLRVHALQASTESEIQTAFKGITDLRGEALLIVPDPLFNGLSAQLAALTLGYRIPAIYQFRAFADAGGLMSYGGSITDAYYQAGIYTGRVLKGDNPADLPVQQSTKVELIVNLRTAKALDLTVPQILLATADEVIE